MAAAFRGPEPGVGSNPRPPAVPLAARESRRVWKLMMLAPSLETFESLLREEPVPLHLLDPFWVESFGLRERP